MQAGEDEGANIEDVEDNDQGDAWVNMMDTWGEESDESDGSLIMSFQLMEIRDKFIKSGGYRDTDILLDTGSTMSVFNNPKMLVNIRKSEKTMRAYSNGGYQDTNQVGDFPGMFTVWYNKDSMLNILSFKDVRENFRITMDTAE